MALHEHAVDDLRIDPTQIKPDSEHEELRFPIQRKASYESDGIKPSEVAKDHFLTADEREFYAKQLAEDQKILQQQHQSFIDRIAQAATGDTTDQQAQQPQQNQPQQQQKQEPKTSTAATNQPSQQTETKKSTEESKVQKQQKEEKQSKLTRSSAVEKSCEEIVSQQTSKTEQIEVKTTAIKQEKSSTASQSTAESQTAIVNKTEVKTSEVKSAEVKPTETKPTESKVSATKPIESDSLSKKEQPAKTEDKKSSEQKPKVGKHVQIQEPNKQQTPTEKTEQIQQPISQEVKGDSNSGKIDTIEITEVDEPQQNIIALNQSNNNTQTIEIIEQQQQNNILAHDIIAFTNQPLTMASTDENQNALDVLTTEAPQDATDNNQSQSTNQNNNNNQDSAASNATNNQLALNQSSQRMQVTRFNFGDKKGPPGQPPSSNLPDFLVPPHLITYETSIEINFIKIPPPLPPPPPKYVKKMLVHTESLERRTRAFLSGNFEVGTTDSSLRTARQKIRSLKSTILKSDDEVKHAEDTIHKAQSGEFLNIFAPPIVEQPLYEFIEVSSPTPRLDEECSENLDQRSERGQSEQTDNMEDYYTSKYSSRSSRRRVEGKSNEFLCIKNYLNFYLCKLHAAI